MNPRLFPPGPRSSVPFVNDGFFYGCFVLISAATAIALGLRQTLGESIHGTYPFLFHRPADRRLARRREVVDRSRGLLGIGTCLDPRIRPLGGHAGNSRQPVSVVDDRARLADLVQHDAGLSRGLSHRHSPGTVVRAALRFGGGRHLCFLAMGAGFLSEGPLAQRRGAARALCDRCSVRPLADRGGLVYGKNTRLSLIVRRRRRHKHDHSIRATSVRGADDPPDRWRRCGMVCCRRYASHSLRTCFSPEIPSSPAVPVRRTPVLEEYPVEMIPPSERRRPAVGCQGAGVRQPLGLRCRPRRWNPGPAFGNGDNGSTERSRLARIGFCPRRRTPWPRLPRRLRRRNSNLRLTSDGAVSARRSRPRKTDFRSMLRRWYPRDLSLRSRARHFVVRLPRKRRRAAANRLGEGIGNPPLQRTAVIAAQPWYSTPSKPARRVGRSESVPIFVRTRKQIVVLNEDGKQLAAYPLPAELRNRDLTLPPPRRQQGSALPA